MTYRARLEGTSETDSGSLISLIEQWVRGGASVIVTGVLMTVDSDCSVAITHLSEPECSPPLPSPTPVVEGDFDNNSMSHVVTMIGGSVAAVVLMIGFTSVILVFCVLKHRCCRGKSCVNKYAYNYWIILEYLSVSHAGVSLE